MTREINHKTAKPPTLTNLQRAYQEGQFRCQEKKSKSNHVTKLHFKAPTINHIPPVPATSPPAIQLTLQLGVDEDGLDDAALALVCGAQSARHGAHGALVGAGAAGRVPAVLQQPADQARRVEQRLAVTSRGRGV